MIDQAQDAILAAAKSALPDLAQCEPYVGQFGAEGPTRGRVVAPAFFVAVLDAPYAQDQPGDGRLALDVRFAAYCLARNAYGPADRGRDATSMAVTFAQIVPQAQWGLAPAVQHARLEGAQNLYSAALDDKGFALWAVTWRQVIMVGESIWRGGSRPHEVWFGWQPEAFPRDYDRVVPQPDHDGSEP